MSKAEWPEVGELVVGTVERIVPYGAYVKLDDYEGKEGLIHVSELSSSWVRNIREHVREGQKVVLQVLRIDREKAHIDLSLRRVSARERRERLLEMKQARRGELLLKTAAEKMGVSLEEAYEKVGSAIEARYGSLYSGLEEAVERGEEALIKANIPNDWASVLTEVAKAKVKVPKVRIRGLLELTSTRPDGVEVLKNAFSKAKNAKRKRGTDISIYVLSAPRYRIEVSSRNPKDAEETLELASATAIKAVEEVGGQGKFTREH